MTCQDCEYFVRDVNKQSGYGKCFRFPPVLTTSSSYDGASNTSSVRPEIYWLDKKCGEFLRKVD